MEEDESRRQRRILAGEIKDADEELERALQLMRERAVSESAIAFALLERALTIGFNTLGREVSKVVHDSVRALESAESDRTPPSTP